MTEPLVDELAALFAAERAAPVVSAAARVASRAKLAAVVGSAPLGAAATAGVLGGTAAKMLAVLAIAAGAGIGAHHVASKGGAEASAPAVAAPAVAASAPVGVMPAPPAVPTEASLLRAAWAEPDPARALAIVQRDAQLHPDGPLAEERAVIEVRALAGLHRDPEARSAAAQVLALYPHSVHRALVERILDGKVP